MIKKFFTRIVSGDKVVITESAEFAAAYVLHRAGLLVVDVDDADGPLICRIREDNESPGMSAEELRGCGANHPGWDPPVDSYDRHYISSFVREVRRSLQPVDLAYRGNLQDVADEIVSTVLRKDKEYGASWKHRPLGVFFMLARKWDRIEEAMKNGGDIVRAAVADDRDEGIEDDLRDLVGYLLLVLAEVRSTRNR